MATIRKAGGTKKRQAAKGAAKAGTKAGTTAATKARKKAPAKAAAPAKKSARPRAAAGAGLTELIGRALTDEQFRVQLFEDRDRAARGFKLSRTDRAALDRLTLEQLEEHAARLGGRASLTIKVVITKSF